MARSELVPTLTAALSLKTIALSDASHVISLVPLNTTSLAKSTVPSILTAPARVVNPVILRFLPVTSSYVISPVTYKFPPIVVIPEIATLPVSASTVTAVPTLIPPFAVTIPANAALPVEEIVAEVPT